MNKTAKDMSKVYAKTPTMDLVRNRMRKQHEMNKMLPYGGFWMKKERSRLEHMIKQIDAELEARRLQQPLF